MGQRDSQTPTGLDYIHLRPVDRRQQIGKRSKVMTSRSTIARTDFPTSRVPVVNVATVPQRSPLRYPGGKTWLIPHIREWLRRTKPEILIEPFAGGAVVSLTAVMEDLAESAIMVEIDRDVAAFWRSVLESGATLQEWIGKFDPTLDRLREIEKSPPGSVVEHGFRTLVLNRTRRGGVLANGASFCKTGENGRGLRSRWYPETLASRLAAIQEYSDRLAFAEGDGMKLLPILLRDGAVTRRSSLTRHTRRRAGRWPGLGYTNIPALITLRCSGCWRTMGRISS